MQEPLSKAPTPQPTSRGPASLCPFSTSDLPEEESLLDKQRSWDEQRSKQENFPVAMRLLSPKIREALLALYGFARMVDDIGDEPLTSHNPASDNRLGHTSRSEDQGSSDLPGWDVQHRLDALNGIEEALERCITQGCSEGFLAPISQVIVANEIPLGPFRKLIEANRVDQTKHRYASFEELIHYCTLSANPIGEIVLRVFGTYRSAIASLSDDVCTALQIVEHLQDVSEDYSHDRIYIPQSDLAKVGLSQSQFRSDVAKGQASEALRRAIALEARRARVLMQSCTPLLAALRGQARLAIAGFAAGGFAALDSLEQSKYDPLLHVVRPTKARTARHLSALLLNASKIRPSQS